MVLEKTPGFGLSNDQTGRCELRSVAGFVNADCSGVIPVFDLSSRVAAIARSCRREPAVGSPQDKCSRVAAAAAWAELSHGSDISIGDSRPPLRGFSFLFDLILRAGARSYLRPPLRGLRQDFPDSSSHTLALTRHQSDSNQSNPTLPRRPGPSLQICPNLQENLGPAGFSRLP